MSDGPEVEVIEGGSEPLGVRQSRGPLPDGLRAATYVTVAALAAGALWLTAHHGLPASTTAPVAATAQAAATGQTHTVYPSPDITALLPARHDLAASPVPGQRSFIAFSTHILLFLHLTFSGSAPVRVVDGRVPQDGAYPDAGAGGLTAGTTENVALHTGVPTEVFVRTRVSCPQVLAGDPVDHLDLVTQATGEVPRLQLVDLTPLGAYWDEARHAACSRPDATQALTVSVEVSTMVGSPVYRGARPWVDAALSLHNAAGFDAVAVLSRAAPAGLTLSALALTTAGAVVEGGATFLGQLRWVVQDCALARVSGPPTLDFAVDLVDSHARIEWTPDPGFAAAWRIALAKACG